MSGNNHSSSVSQASNTNTIMNAFQIRLNNIAITMGTLDKEAADSFGVEYSEKDYASPYPDFMFGSLHWFDIIGAAITRLELGEHTWDEVITEYANADNPAYEPFNRLCKEWEAKNYIPVTVE